MECAICLERYADPDRLPQVFNCGHTFCEKCVKIMATSGGRVSCPTCRCQTTLSEVKINFALRDQLNLGPAQDQEPIVPDEPLRPPPLPTAEELDVTLSLQAFPCQSAICNLLAPGQEATPMTDVLLRLQPPEGCQRTPVDICCIVDVSDSMGTQAVTQDGAGAKVAHSLAVLDIVKHALKTIVNTMEEYDRIALVTYANDAKTVAELTPMNAAGRKTVERRLELLQLDGMTNLWAGLNRGIELLSAASEPGRLQHVMLLTDGVPNINPPRGIIPMLKRLRQKGSGGSLPCTISTFGFGYELDSDLLAELASIGGGSYAFIPDSGFVGTVFVNAVSNLLVTMATDVSVTLEPLNGATFTARNGDMANGVLGGYEPIPGGNGSIKLDVGTLQFGQSREVVVRMAVPASSSPEECVRATVSYKTRAAEEGTLQQRVQERCLTDGIAVEEMEEALCRLTFVDAMRRIMKSLKLSKLDVMQGKTLPLGEAVDLVQALETAISSSAAASSERTGGLLEDIHGQVAEAVSKDDFYKKWGVHYLPSLMCAHLAQQCNNFKDPGVQLYGGDLFNDLRDKADEIFLGLDPPKPSTRPAQASAPASNATATARTSATATPTVSMASYYDRYAG